MSHQRATCKSCTTDHEKYGCARERKFLHDLFDSLVRAQPLSQDPLERREQKAQQWQRDRDFAGSSLEVMDRMIVDQQSLNVRCQATVDAQKARQVFIPQFIGAPS